MALSTHNTPSGFLLPSIHSAPPFFTQQHNPSTLASFTQQWIKLILAYARHRKLFFLRVEDAEGEWDEVLKNDRINRKVLPGYLEYILSIMVSQNVAVYEPAKQNRTVLLYWRLPEEWAETLHDWATATGHLNTIMTFYEITDPPVESPLTNIPIPLLRRAISILAKTNLAQVIAVADGDGVRFFPNENGRLESQTWCPEGLSDKTPGTHVERILIPPIRAWSLGKIRFTTATTPAMANRVVMYYQTQFKSDGSFISPLPLIGYVTHILVAAFHINANVNDVIHLNNYPPNNAYFAELWPALDMMQGNGTKVMGMLGGAARGSYDCLSTEEGFNVYYPPLKEVIETYHLDGMDLDVEEATSLDTILRIITQLKTDFGDDFIITLAPVASALLDKSNLSGFNYTKLDAQAGDKIEFYNAQFYSGFGSFFPEDTYIDIIEHGLQPWRLTATVLMTPEAGNGYVSRENVVSSIRNLMEKYGNGWGGVGAWEYGSSGGEHGDAIDDHAMPQDGEYKPWEWAISMHEAMKAQVARMRMREIDDQRRGKIKQLNRLS